MNIIYKYPLHAPVMGLNLPAGSTVRSVGEDPSMRDTPALWIEHTMNTAYYETRTFAGFGTGMAIPDGHAYVGTAVMGSGLIWHIYERED